MTTPPHDENNNGDDKDKDDPNPQQPSEYPQYPNYPQYPATSHPEDAPGYGTQGGQGYQGYQEYPSYDQSQGYQTYGARPQPSAQYGDGAAFGNVTDGGLNPHMVTTDGRINVMRAVKWGFSTTFSNAAVFILGTLATGLVFMVLSVVSGFVSQGMGGTLAGSLFELLFGLISVVWMIFVVRLMIWQVDKVKAGYGDLFKDVHFVQGFITSIVVSLIQGFVVGLPFFLWAANNANNLNSLDSPEATEAFFAENGASMFAVLGGLMVLALLIAPFLLFPVEFATEGRAGIGAALGQAFQIGKRNYGSLLIYNVVVGIVATILMIVTLGLAALVVVPAIMLAQAHMYRQGAGGPIPHNPDYDGPLGGYGNNPDIQGGYQGFA